MRGNVQKTNVMAVGNFEFITTPVTIANSTVNIAEHPDASGQAAGPFAPTVSNMLVETDQGVDIIFNWDQTAGSFWLNGGNWAFDVWLEEMGPGEAPAASGHFTGNVAATPVNGNGYTFTLSIGANVIQPGVYRVTVAQQFHSLGQPRALAMFGDIGLVKFFTAAP